MTYEALLLFDTDNPEFARGFEVGRIYEMLVNDNAEVMNQPFHASNVEMVLRIAEARGLTVTAEFTDDPTWMVLR